MLKLFIGDIEYPLQKKSWVPTLASVQSTQVINSKYLYNTIIIFKKSTDYDLQFSITSDVLYTSSELDSFTEHSGSDGYITIPGYYDYFDGASYYSYLCLYSNTFNLWDINNTLTDGYAIKYDQSSVSIYSDYILNEWYITNNVDELIIYDNINNVEKLILPNLTKETTIIDTYWKVNCKEYELFDVADNLTEVETFNGLLYTVGQEILIATPKDYQLDKYNNFYVSNYCLNIRDKSISNGDDLYFNKEINMIYGENVTTLGGSALYKLQVHIINFPKLETIAAHCISSNAALTTLYLPSSLISMDQNSINSTPETFLYINFGINLGENMTTPIYLQDCEYLDVNHTAIQFYNLAKIEKGSNYIYLHPNVYDYLTVDQIIVAEDKGWVVTKL